VPSVSLVDRVTELTSVSPKTLLFNVMIPPVSVAGALKPSKSNVPPAEVLPNVPPAEVLPNVPPAEVLPNEIDSLIPACAVWVMLSAAACCAAPAINAAPASMPAVSELFSNRVIGKSPVSRAGGQRTVPCMNERLLSHGSVVYGVNGQTNSKTGTLTTTIKSSNGKPSRQ
jgi:hypothetical protein